MLARCALAVFGSTLLQPVAQEQLQLQIQLETTFSSLSIEYQHGESKDEGRKLRRAFAKMAKKIAMSMLSLSSTISIPPSPPSPYALCLFIDAHSCGTNTRLLGHINDQASGGRRSCLQNLGHHDK